MYFNVACSAQMNRSQIHVYVYASIESKIQYVMMREKEICKTCMKTLY